MKVSTFRSVTLLVASLLCAGTVTVMTGALPVCAATPAGTAESTGFDQPAGTAEPTGFDQQARSGIALLADDATPATGTEADAAAPSAVPGVAVPGIAVPGVAVQGVAVQGVAAPGAAVPPPDASDTDWESHGAQDDAAPRTPDDRRHHSIWRRRHHSDGSHDAVVNVFDDSVLDAGKEAESVVSVFGNTRVEGTVREDVVSVFGNTYIDGKVDGDAVAVFGNVDLGPHAQIEGDVTTVAGKVRRDPAAIVQGESSSVFARDFGGAGGLRSWIDHCLLYGRPLSLTHGLGWAWGVALSFLALYLCIALVFRQGVERCAETFERQPGHSVLAALLAVLLTPVLMVLLFITVVGMAAVPFALMGFLCVALFGKTVILAWLGRRVLRVRDSGASAANVSTTVAWSHPALAVLIGGLIALMLYLVPFFGFVFYKLLGFLGFGAVVYTAILGLQARQSARTEGAPSAAMSAGAANAGPAMAARATSNDPAPGAAAAAAAAHGPGAAADPSIPPTGDPSAAADPSIPPTGGPGATADSSIPLTGAVPPIDGAPPGVPPANTTAARGATPFAAAASGLPRAGFWIRMAALFLDVLLVGLVVSVLHPVAHAHVVLLAAYGAVMWKLRGSTVGGIVFNLRVVRLDGQEMDWETSIIRALSCFLSLAVVGLGFFWIAFDDANQAWHDKIAGTVVVRVPKGVPQSP